jgi:hypothetical protein
MYIIRSHSSGWKWYYNLFDEYEVTNNIHFNSQSAPPTPSAIG